jgi:hypothetical protein
MVQSNKQHKMKNILFAVFILAGFTASAQSTTPRFGITASRDNTFRTLTNGWATGTDAAGADTLSFRPLTFNNVYKITMTDSVAFKISSTVNSFAGDHITIICTGDSGDFIKFVGSNIKADGNSTLSTNGRSVIGMIFDGAYWVESSRSDH